MAFAPHSRIRPRRSLLLTSPLKPDSLTEGLKSGADIVCIDLEDAYNAGNPSGGRAAWKSLASSRDRTSRSQVFTRINSAKSAEGVRDLAFLLDEGIAIDGLMLPKVDSADEVKFVDQILTDAGLADIELGIIIETASGLEYAPAIAAVSTRITWISFGGYDLSAALGITMSWDALLRARARTSHAAAMAGVQVFDCPAASSDLEIVRDEAMTVRDLGFTGKACRAANQIPVVHAAFAPSAKELERARRVVEAADEGFQGTLVVDGKMIEPPTILNYRRQLAMVDAG
jgi:(S)-citramalyl-CoA lyase